MKRKPLQERFVKRLMILLPVLNEAEGLDAVLKTIPYAPIKEAGWVSEIVVVDGKSTDASQQIGINAGCTVLVLSLIHI